MTQVVPVEQKAVTLSTPIGSWGTEDSSFSDKNPSYLIIAQGNTDLITSGKCRPGDIYSSEDSAVVAASGKPFEFVPVLMMKQWRSEFKDEKDGGKWKKKEVLSYEKGKKPEWKKNQEWRKDTWIEGGLECQGFLLITVFALPVSDLNAVPFVLQLKKGSLFHGGKAVASYAADCAARNVPLASNTLILSASQKINPVNNIKFFAFDIAKGRPTANEEIEKAYGWYKNLDRNKIAGAEATVSEGDTEAVPF